MQLKWPHLTLALILMTSAWIMKKDQHRPERHRQFRRKSTASLMLLWKMTGDTLIKTKIISQVSEDWRGRQEPLKTLQKVPWTWALVLRLSTHTQVGQISSFAGKWDLPYATWT